MCTAFRSLFVLPIAIAVTCTSLQAQTGSPPVKSETSNLSAKNFDPRAFRAGPVVTQPILRSTFGNEFPIFRTAEGSESLYYYIPPVFVDFQLLEKRTNDACASKSEALKVQLPVSFYNETLIDEMKEHLLRLAADKTKPISVGIPQASGVLLFAFDENLVPYKILSTVVEQTLLTGYQMASLSGGMESSSIATFSGSCEQLRSIVQARKLAGFLIAPGVNVKMNSLRAVASIIGNQQFKESLDNEESGVNKVVVGSDKKAGGFSLKAAGINIGGQGGKTKTTTDTIKYRIINRNWIHGAIQSKLSSMNIQQTCDSETCGDTKIVELILTQLFSGFSEEQVTFNKQGETFYANTKSKGDIPIGKLKVDEELRSELNNSLKAKKEVEAEAKGVKVKNSDDFDTTDHAGVTWKKAGDDWFPVTMKAHIYDAAEISKRIETTYNQTILGTTDLVAARMMVIYTPGPDASRKVEIERIADVKKALDSYYQNRKVLPIDMNRPPPPTWTAGPTDRKLGFAYVNNNAVPLHVEIEATPTDGYCYLAIKINGARVAVHESHFEATSMSFTGCQVATRVPPLGMFEVNSRGNFADISWRETATP